MKKFLMYLSVIFVFNTQAISNETNKKASFICIHDEHGYDYQFFIDIQKSEAQLGPYKFFNLQISDEAIYSSSSGTNGISFFVFERYTGAIQYTITNLNKTEIIRSDSYKCSKAKKLF